MRTVRLQCAMENSLLYNVDKIAKKYELFSADAQSAQDLSCSIFKQKSQQQIFLNGDIILVTKVTIRGELVIII